MSSYMSVIGGNDVTLIWTSQVRFDEGGKIGNEDNRLTTWVR